MRWFDIILPVKTLTPEFLYRLTYPDKFRFDESGYLLPHGPEGFLEKLLYGGQVPMVTENDWNVIVKHFGSRETDFLKLTIASGQTELLTAGKHAYLAEPEFFAKVPKKAILKVERCKLFMGVPLTLDTILD